MGVSFRAKRTIQNSRTPVCEQNHTTTLFYATNALSQQKIALYTALFTSVNTFYSSRLVIPSRNIYFMDTQTLPDGSRLPPLPGAVLFLWAKCYFFHNDYRNRHRGHRLSALHRLEYRTRLGCPARQLRHERALQGDSARGAQGVHRADHDAVRRPFRATFGRACFARDYPVHGDANSRLLFCIVFDVLYGDRPF